MRQATNLGTNPVLHDIMSDAANRIQTEVERIRDNASDLNPKGFRQVNKHLFQALESVLEARDQVVFASNTLADAIQAGGSN